MQLPIKRVLVTQKAIDLIEKLQKTHGALLFHQSGGCCDGSAPMCFPEGEFRIVNTDILLGTVHGCPFYIASFQYEYWKHSQITLDVVEGRGSSFSLEIPLGVRFIVETKLFTEAQLQAIRMQEN